MALVEPRAAPASDLTIHDAEPEQHAVFTEIAARAFGVPAPAIAQLLPSEVLADYAVRTYVGSVGGVPVSVGMGITLGDAVGIFNIATEPEFQHRGYGAAITARAVDDGFAAGAEFAWLQSSDAGFHVYERLGFRHLESWRCWVSSTD